MFRGLTALSSWHTIKKTTYIMCVIYSHCRPRLIMDTVKCYKFIRIVE